MLDNTRFFIVGSGRSGSTLLRLLLMGHSRIHIPPETWFIIPLVEKLPLRETLSPAQVMQAAEFMTSDYRWPDMNIPAAKFKSRAEALNAPRLRDVIDLVYADQLRTSGKARLGDKTPPYIAIVPQLAALYPDAKFIHLIRDGRDVAISYIELGYGSRYYDGGRFEWIAAMDRACSYRKSKYADRILEVRYERLVAHPEPALREICAFLGETYEPQMLENRQIEAVPQRERYIHPNLGRPISEARVAVWRDRLSPFACFCMEACLAARLVAFGYPLRFAHRFWRPLLAMANLALRSAAPLLNRAMPYLGKRGLLPLHFYF